MLHEDRTPITSHASKAMKLTVLVIALSALPLKGYASETDIERKLESLQREIDELKAARERDATVTASPQIGTTGPQVTFGGQYRINSYSADNDFPNQGRQQASRVRIRQNIDLRFTEQFKTHLQMELGHTIDNVDTSNNSSRKTNVAVRHALMDYTTGSGVNFQAGIVPLGDYFGDTLFSADWNYNPVALSAVAPVGLGKLRGFVGSLRKGSETNTTTNDLTHYQADYVLPLSGNNQINFGLTLVRAVPGSLVKKDHTNFGVGAKFDLGNSLALNGFLVGSRTEKELLGTAANGSGTAAKVELTGEAGRGKFGLLLTHATGRSSGNGFLPVEALARTNGYWGYTGILTIQGPTDTGFDGDSVNISNNGFGLSTVQAKYSFPITADLTGYVGAGWFGNSKTPAGRSKDLGTDWLLMGTYRFNKFLTLDFGGAYAKLKDAVSGYSNGVIGGASFNQPMGVSRNKSALFTRLQAEF